MKILKWIVVFVIAFLFAWILIFTFNQPPFREVAPARILSYWTPAIPIYIYVAGAFGIGLLLGLFAAFYYYFTQHKKVHKATKELHVLEERLAEAKRALEQYEVQEVHTEDMNLPLYEEKSVVLDDDDENNGDENIEVDAEDKNEDSAGPPHATAEKGPV